MPLPSSAMVGPVIHAPVGTAGQVDREVDALQLATRIADRCVVSDVECMGVRDYSLPAGPWYDVRPLLDEREHSPMVIDMARDALAWGLHRGLLQRHDCQQHLVRVMRMPD